MGSYNVSPEFEAELKRLGINPEEEVKDEGNSAEKKQQNEDGNVKKNVTKEGEKRRRGRPSGTRKNSSEGGKVSFVTVSVSTDVAAALKRYHSAYCIFNGKESLGDFLLKAVRQYVSKECRKADDFVSSLED